MFLKIKYRIEYGFVRSFDIFFALWPRRVALAMGEMLGLLLSFIIWKRRRLITANLTMAFPEKKPEEISDIARGVWRNIGRVAAEFLRLSDITRQNFRDYFVLDNPVLANAARDKNAGVVYVTMHFANWEYCGVGYQFFFNDNVAIARPMKNPLVEAWVKRKRAASGLEVILHRDAVRGSLRVLKQKKTIGILTDQNLYQGGVFVDFFGRPAATTTLPALLNERTGAPVQIFYSLREGTRFRLVAEAPIEFPLTPAGVDPLQFKTQIIATALERIIRRDPDQWFWIHNRWKRKVDINEKESFPTYAAQ